MALDSSSCDEGGEEEGGCLRMYEHGDGEDGEGEGEESK